MRGTVVQITYLQIEDSIQLSCIVSLPICSASRTIDKDGYVHSILLCMFTADVTPYAVVYEVWSALLRAWPSPLQRKKANPHSKLTLYTTVLILAEHSGLSRQFVVSLHTSIHSKFHPNPIHLIFLESHPKQRDSSDESPSPQTSA